MQHDIIAKANGIFLWVVLVVAMLEKDVDGGRFHALQARLREIPEGLPDLFKTIVGRDAEHKNEFVLCLRWILYAWRPLTLREWYFAMMAGVDDRSDWVGRVEEGTTNRRMETFLLSSSKGLAELTKGETITAQFIHESVRGFLVVQSGFKEICDDSEALESIAHEQLKHCCLRGMIFDLPRQLEQRKSKKELLTEGERNSLRAEYPFAEYATTHILQHADRAAKKVCQKHFLAEEFSTSDWVQRFYAFQKKKSNVYRELPSWSYLCAERDLTKLVDRPTQALLPSEQQRYRTPLIAAIVHSSWNVLRIFLTDMGARDVDEIVTEVQAKAKPKRLSGAWSDRPWVWAVINNLVYLLRHLLKSVPVEDVDANIRSIGYSHNALHRASHEGNEEVVETLIAKGADVNATADGWDHVYALQIASVNGHEKVVKSLLAAGADVNAQGGNYGYALQAASFRAHSKVVEMLLASGADVHTRGGKYGKALKAALSHEAIYPFQSKVIAILRARGAVLPEEKKLGT